MERIKCITFDKEAQDSLPQHIKDKMKADRDKARQELDEVNKLALADVMKTVCSCGCKSYTRTINRKEICQRCGKDW